MMKKLLMSIAAVAVCSTAAFAQSNSLAVEAARVTKGQSAKLTVKIASAEANVQSIGAYITAPAGMTVSAVGLGALNPTELVNEKAEANTIQTNTVEGIARVALLGSSGMPLTATEGQAFTVTVDVPSDLAAGEYPIVLSNVELCTTDSKAINLVDEVSTTLKVTIPGDVNADSYVNSSDVLKVLKGMADEYNVSDDANNDDIINSSDVLFVLKNMAN